MGVSEVFVVSVVSEGFFATCAYPLVRTEIFKNKQGRAYSRWTF